MVLVSNGPTSYSRRSIRQAVYGYDNEMIRTSSKIELAANCLTKSDEAVM